MTLFITGFIIGIFLGAYLGNKAFRERVNKAGRSFYGQLEKLAGVNEPKKKRAK